MAPAWSCPCWRSLARSDRRRNSRVPTSTSAFILPETFGGISNPAADRAIPRAVLLAEHTSSGRGSGSFPTVPPSRWRSATSCSGWAPIGRSRTSGCGRGWSCLKSRSSTSGATTLRNSRPWVWSSGRTGGLFPPTCFPSPSGDPLLDPYVIKSVSPEPSAPAIRVGFIGFAVSKHSSESGASYRWENPSESAGKWLPELREKCDYVIALACMPLGDAIQLAIDHKGIDMILNGFEHQTAMSPIKISRSTIVYAEDEAKSLGELRFS